MKTSSSTISSLVLILSLAACGGSSPSDDSSSNSQNSCTPIQLSAWSACQQNGTQTRTVLAGNCLNAEPLVQACAYCASIGRLTCIPQTGPSMCCPPAAPFYCPSATLCYSDANVAVAQCGSAAMACTF